MTEFPTIPTYYEQLDPGLSHVTNMFIVTLLAEMRWCEFEAIREPLKITAAVLSCHLAKLRQDGYVESCGEERASRWRLTLRGCERLIEHLDVVHFAATRAREVLKSEVPTDPEATA